MQGSIAGSLETPGPAALPALGQNTRVIWGTPVVSVGVADARGISGEPKLELGDKNLPIRRGTMAPGMKSGFHAIAEGVQGNKVETIPFRIDLRQAGTGRFGLVLLGEITTAELRGNWPHLSFGGNYLPRSREITPAGFSARWSTTALASSADDARIRLRRPDARYAAHRLVSPRQARRRRAGSASIPDDLSVCHAVECNRRLTSCSSFSITVCYIFSAIDNPNKGKARP